MAKILLIEDEAALREMLADELKAQGHQITEAGDGAEGLEKILTGNPDLILCDRAMPGLSGYEVLERIRKQHPQYNNIPFIFLTALADPRDRAAIEHLRPSAYIDKPVDFKMLGDKINSLIGAK